MVESELNLPNSVVYIMASFINFKLGLSTSTWNMLIAG